MPSLSIIQPEPDPVEVSTLTTDGRTFSTASTQFVKSTPGDWVGAAQVVLTGVEVVVGAGAESLVVVKPGKRSITIEQPLEATRTESVKIRLKASLALDLFIIIPRKVISVLMIYQAKRGFKRLKMLQGGVEPS